MIFRYHAGSTTKVPDAHRELLPVVKLAVPVLPGDACTAVDTPRYAPELPDPCVSRATSVLGVAVIAWLLVLSARTVVPPQDRPVRDRNRRGHGLGRWLEAH